MINRFMISVAAAALIAGTGFANAQGTGGMNREGGGAATQQTAPSGSPSGGNAQSKEGMGKETVKGAQSKEGMGKDSVKGAQSKEGMGKDSVKDAQSKDSTKSGTNSAQSTDSKSTTTTGNAATSATAAPPPEKRTQIVSAIRSEKIEETTNVNFNISVGATVPATVRFRPLPARIVEIFPEWRGYEVILVHGRYIIEG